MRKLKRRHAVTSTELPWFGLEAGKVDTRRVNARGRWNFFWAVMPRIDVALVLQLNQLPDPLPELPNLKNLEIKFQTLLGGAVIYIRLKDLAQKELFEILCRDVVSAGEQGETESDALDRFIRRTYRWHYLLRGGKTEILTEEEQKGLIGEIEILKIIMLGLGAKAALTSWTGPSGAPKDFELAADCIEVKAKRVASQPFVSISNEHQLADVTDRALWLAVLAVDKVQQPYGKVLPECISEVTSLIERDDPALVPDWDAHLADAGYDPLHDYSQWRWQKSEPVFYSVTEGFPRIGAPIPLGVSHVEYSISLSACAPYQSDWSTVKRRLFGVNRNE